MKFWMPEKLYWELDAALKRRKHMNEKTEAQKQEQAKARAAALREMYSKMTKKELIEDLILKHFRHNDLLKESREMVMRQRKLEAICRSQYSQLLAKDDLLLEARANAKFWHTRNNALNVIALSKRFERMVEDEKYQAYCEAIMEHGASKETLDKVLREQPELQRYVEEVIAAASGEAAMHTLNARNELKACEAREKNPLGIDQ